MAYKWATFELNLRLLDGSFDLIPDELSEVQTGWRSESMCDENAVRISAEIRKWHNAHRRARISEISAGIIEEYTKSSVVSASIINEMNLPAQASGAIVWVDRYDIIRVERKTISDISVIYNECNCIESPKPSIDEYINTADSVIRSYIVDSVDSEITQANGGW